MQPTFRLIIAAVSVGMLASCGGGSGGASGPPPTPPTVEVLPPVDISPVAANDPGSSLPADWMNGAFMEIYVRGYQDSDGDGIGDLKGLIQRLDYLKDLGVTGLWLMPVTQSQDHDHGYAVSDYRNIETQYGSLADLDELLRQAHARGLGVILDYVMNHSAAQHPAFVNSRAAVTNSFRNWYVWQSNKPTGWNIYGGDPWRSASTGFYFAPFWDQMPDFNLTNAATVAWHHDNLRFWLNRGVDGFRFDAVGNLVENGPATWENQPQNYALMGDVRRMMDGYARRFLVCEAPADPAGFGQPSACGSAFAFGHQLDIIKAAKGDAAALRAVADYPPTVPATMATMVSNHDSFAGERLWDQVGGNLAQYRLAAATYLLQPGVPFIYYGEEIGLAGAAGLSGDPRMRTPMSWTADSARAGFTTGTPFRALSANVATQNVATQQADASSLLAFYKSMLALRANRASLRRGSYEGATVSAGTLVFRRVHDVEQTVVAINYGSSPATVAVGGLSAGQSYPRLWPRDGTALPADGAGNASPLLPAHAVAIWGR